MIDEELVRTVILQAPNFIGFGVALVLVHWQNRMLIALVRTLTDRCDCRDAREKLTDIPTRDQPPPPPPSP